MRPIRATRVLHLIGSAALLTALVSSTTSAGAYANQSPRVDDRVVVCSTRVAAGTQRFYVYFKPWQAPSDATRESAATASVFTGSIPDVTSLVVVTAGPKAFATSARVDSRLCRPQRAILSLTPRGLPPPPVRFDQRIRCSLGGRLLVRTRVVSEGRRVTRAEIAVRMESGIPIAYARINRDGYGVFYPSPRCD